MNADDYHQMRRIAEERQFRAHHNAIPMDKDEAMRRARMIMGIPVTEVEHRTLRKSAVVSVAVVIVGSATVIIALPLLLSVISPFHLFLWTCFVVTINILPGMTFIFLRFSGVGRLMCCAAAAAILALEVAFMWMFSLISS